MTQTNDQVDDLKDQTQPVADEEKKQDVETEEVETNLDSEQVDYKDKFSQSAKEAIRLTKENESLASKATLQQKMIEVAKDQEQIHEIARHTPEIADQICKEFGWGETYADATAGETKKSEVDPRVAAREVYTEMEQKKEREAIENYEVDFFIANKISIGSPKYKAIMSTYSKYEPKTLADSQELFQMAYSKHIPSEEAEIPAPNGEIGGSGVSKKSDLTDEDRQMMKERGWDEKKMKDFKSSNLY